MNFVTAILGIPRFSVFTVFPLHNSSANMDHIYSVYNISFGHNWFDSFIKTKNKVWDE